MSDSPHQEALKTLGDALKAGPKALARSTGIAARTNFVDRLATLAHRLDVGGHGGANEVYEAASIIARMQRNQKHVDRDGWSVADHEAIAGLKGIETKLLKLANDVEQ
ncbi:hypothetical protein ACGGKE_18730 (plasmid) [Sphingobium naphthae]|uniref:hypothetical protein n=1 Tax=Sphingobium naphthae TaxID=1886786 RepID=UPI0037485CE6